VKKYFFLMVAALSIAAAGFSQTYGTRNISGNIVRKVTTSNNTATQIDAITVANNETGIIEITAIGMVSDTSGACTGALRYKYAKTSAGTLTLTAQDTVQAVTNGVHTTGALFAASVVSNNISIKVTGVSSQTIRWAAITRQWYRTND
jgi:hypothetical protein